MKSYTVLYAEDVPHYGTLAIEAESDAEAIAKAKAHDPSGITMDPIYENSVCRRIAHIEDAAGNSIAYDIALDNCFLRYGGESARKLCDAAPALLKALQQIAAIPLWGEPIADEALRSDLVSSGEYDAAENEFEPSCDTESSQLRDAVETARAALTTAEGGAP